MNSMVLIMILMCGEPKAMVGWGMEAQIAFFGTMDYIEQDADVSRAVQFLLNHPDTDKVQYELVSDQEWKLKCGTKA